MVNEISGWPEINIIDNIYYQLSVRTNKSFLQPLIGKTDQVKILHVMYK